MHKACLKLPQLLTLPPHTEATCNSRNALNRVWEKKRDVQCLSLSSGKNAKGALGHEVLLPIKQPLVFPHFFSTAEWLSRHLLELHSIEKYGGKDRSGVERFVLVLMELDCWQPHACSLGSGSVANPLLIHKVNYVVV